MKVYVDTSVFGGCFDVEFKSWSKKLFDEFKAGMKIAVISDLTLKELDQAPANVKKLIHEVPGPFMEQAILGEEEKLLAHRYIDEGAVGNEQLVDSQHIAIATVCRVDVLVSWNFKHIVNLRKIRLYNAVNMKFGHGSKIAD